MTFCVQAFRISHTATMSGGSPPPVDVLEPEGWAHNGNGEIAEGRPQWCEGGVARFRHSRELQAQDVLRTRVVEEGNAYVGFATESFDVDKHVETITSTAVVGLPVGTTLIHTGISEDGEEHYHPRHLKDLIPKTLPYRPGPSHQ